MRIKRRTRRASRLEFIFAAVAIGVLIMVAIDRIWLLRGRAERVGVIHMVATLKSALAIEMARRAVQGGATDLVALESINPITLLDPARLPAKYRGEFDGLQGAHIPAGSWYFSRINKELVYLVAFSEGFADIGPEVHKLTFRVELSYIDSNSNDQFDPGSDHIRSLGLKSMDDLKATEVK